MLFWNIHSYFEVKKRFKKKPIDFSKKIIVFEDIDCIGNIVLNRANKENNNKNYSKNSHPNIKTHS